MGPFDVNVILSESEGSCLQSLLSLYSDPTVQPGRTLQRSPAGRTVSVSAAESNPGFVDIQIIIIIDNTDI